MALHRCYENVEEGSSLHEHQPHSLRIDVKGERILIVECTRTVFADTRSDAWSISRCVERTASELPDVIMYAFDVTLDQVNLRGVTTFVAVPTQPQTRRSPRGMSFQMLEDANRIPWFSSSNRRPRG